MCTDISNTFCQLIECIFYYKYYYTINFINSTEKRGESYYVDIYFTRLNMTFALRVKFLYC